jgi:hypothetical protein
MQVSTRRFLTPLPPANRLAVFNPHFMSEYAVPISLPPIGNRPFDQRGGLTLYNGEPTIPQVHYYHDDIDVSARFCYSLGGSFKSTLGGSLAR